MGKFRVTGPDGKTYMVTAPEGATREQVMQRVQSHASTGKKDTSALNAFVLGARKPIDNMARWLSDTTIGRTLDRAGQAIGLPSARTASDEADALRRNNSRTGFQLAGNIAGTLPLARLPGGPVFQGASSGALLSNKKDLSGVLQDAAIGGVAGKVGDKLARGVARVASPRVAPVVSRLKERGIQMTPGQILGATDSRVGRVVKGVEDRLTGVPVLGDVVSSARRRSVDSFNRSALNEVLKPVGKSLPKTVSTGNDGIAFVESQLGKAYDDVLPKLSAVGDGQFMDDLARIHQDAATMAPARFQQFNNILKDLGRFWQNGVKLTGKDLKAIETRLGQRIRNYGSGADPDARDLASALSQVQSSLREMAARQNPAHAARLKSINQAWANLVRTQRAAVSANGAGGVFTPNQLLMATRTADSSARKSATARGDALMQRFAQDAQSVLPSSVPDSGTAGRLMLGLGGLGYIHPGSAVAGGAAMLPYTVPGQKAAEWLLTGRQGPTAKGIAELIQSLAPVGTSGAAALSVQQP